MVRYGNGWFGFNYSPSEAAAKIKKLEELLATAGRKIEEMEIIMAPRNRRPTLDELRQWRDLCVSELVTGPWAKGASANISSGSKTRPAARLG